MTPFLLTLLLIAPPDSPEPRPVVGDALPARAIARLGPNAFRYAGYVYALHGGGPTVLFSPDGKRIGVTSSTGVYIWDTATGRRLLWVPTDGNVVAGLLGFTPTGDVVVDCRLPDDRRAGVFRLDATTGKVLARFQPAEDRTFTALSPDGKVVFSRTQVNEFTNDTVADEIDTGKEIWRKKHPEMSWMRVSPDGSRLVTWSSRAKWGADVLDAATGKTVGRFDHPDGDSHPAWVCGGVSVGPRADRIVLAHGWNRGFTVFQAGTEKPAWHETGTWHENAFLTDGDKKAVLVRERPRGYEVEVWDLVGKKRLSTVPADVGRAMALAPDGTTLVTTDARSRTGTLQFVDVATGKPVPPSPEPFTRAAVVWYLPDGSLVSADDQFLEPAQWDTKTGAMTPLPGGTKPPASPKPGPLFKPPAGTENAVASPDGSRVLGSRIDPDELDSVPGDTYLGLFDAKGGVVKKYPRPDATAGSVYRFAPDGKTFAVARGDGTIALHHSATGTAFHTFRHAGGVGSLAYSPDGRFLATTCGDGPILVWDVRAAK